MKRRLIVMGITAILAISMFPCVAFAADTWDGTQDTGWYNAIDTSFTLTTGEQLAGLASLVNGGNSFSGKTVVLGDDIDLDGRQWTPIGIDFGHPFEGTISGAGHTVTGLVIGISGSPAMFDYAGLFGHSGSSSRIENLSVQGNVVSGGNSAGVLTGLGVGDIDRCGVSGSVASNSNSGGLAGRAYGSITNSHSDADVTGGSDSGGLVGNYDPDSSDTLSGCYATGEVTISDFCSGGGLIGYFNNMIDITCCYATGDVNTGDMGYAGGFIGMNWSGGAVTISDCFSTGDVTSGSDSCTGGFAGCLTDDTCTLERCFAAGDVTGGLYTGGLVGYSDISITDCYAAGSVNGDASSSVGGLLGCSTAPVETSYARGAVSGGASAVLGGFIGDNSAGVTGGYFDTRGTGQTNGFGMDSMAQTVTGLTTDQMTGTAASANMTGLNFSTVWETKAGDFKWYYPQLSVLANSSNTSVKAESLAGATCTPFTVSFNSNGGSAVENAYGYYTAVAEPASPTKTGFVFEEWCSDSGLTTAYDFSASVTSNITLHAKWIADYRVTFESNGGSAVPLAYVEPGQKAVKPADPTRENHIFGGWYMDTGLTTAYDFSAEVTADFTLYAKWTELTLTSSISGETVYSGGRITLTPSVEGGIWRFDSVFFSREGSTFTVLKAGRSTITYTVGGESVSYDVAIEESDLPQTGQDFTLCCLLLAGAAAAGAAALLLGARRKRPCGYRK